MDCSDCEKTEHSFKEKPFYPPGGYKPGKNTTHQCPCGQRWYCYNDYYCLWGRVNDDLTWKLLERNVDVPFAIGNTCTVLPGYEEYAVDPVHEICNDEVFWPTVRLQPAKGNIKETKVFQDHYEKQSKAKYY